VSSVNFTTDTAQEPVRERIRGTLESLGGLQQRLRALDDDLGALVAQREKYGVLTGVCDSLDKLTELGAGEMFWGEPIDPTKTAEYVRDARQRVAAFHGNIQAVEAERRDLIQELTQGRDVLDILEADLYEKQAAEERRLGEWVVEREISPVPNRAQQMAWAGGGEDDSRFRRSLAIAMLWAALIGTVAMVVDVPLPEPNEIIEVPERLARLIELEQRRAVPPPQPVVPEAEQLRPEEPPDEPVVADQPPPVDAPVAEEQGAPAPVAPEPPRQRAESAGILAFRESFSTIATRRPAAQLGAAARIGNTGASSAGPAERSMVTSLEPGSSGGINLASFSRELGGGGGGGGGIAGVEVGRVASSIGGGGPGGTGPGGLGTGDHASGGGALAGRTDEEIQIVFDRYKAALYRLYNRELRNDPTLRGQVVLRLTIEPDGSVSMCALQSSDMNAPALAAQVVERVKTFAFGAKDVPAITILYPIDFLPAA